MNGATEWPSRRVLVTGATGFVGAWLTRALLRRGAEVVALVRGVIIASSDKAYGETGHLPCAEGHPLAGRHPYDVSKSCADLLASAYHHSYALPVCVTRCGNFYGGGELNWSRIV